MTIAEVIQAHCASAEVSAADALALLRAAAEALRGHAAGIQVTGPTAELMAAMEDHGHTVRRKHDDGWYRHVRISIGREGQNVDIAACRKVEP